MEFPGLFNNFVGEEFEVSLASKQLTLRDHRLKTIARGTEEEDVIGVDEDPEEDASDGVPDLHPPQAEDQLFTINSPQEWRGDTTLADPVRDWKAIGILSIPSDIVLNHIKNPRYHIKNST